MCLHVGCADAWCRDFNFFPIVRKSPCSISTRKKSPDACPKRSAPRKAPTISAARNRPHSELTEEFLAHLPTCGECRRVIRYLDDEQTKLLIARAAEKASGISAKTDYLPLTFSATSAAMKRSICSFNCASTSSAMVTTSGSSILNSKSFAFLNLALASLSLKRNAAVLKQLPAIYWSSLMYKEITSERAAQVGDKRLG